MDPAGISILSDHIAAVLSHRKVMTIPGIIKSAGTRETFCWQARPGLISVKKELRSWKPMNSFLLVTVLWKYLNRDFLAGIRTVIRWDMHRFMDCRMQTRLSEQRCVILILYTAGKM